MVCYVCIARGTPNMQKLLCGISQIDIYATDQKCLGDALKWGNKDNTRAHFVQIPTNANCRFLFFPPDKISDRKLDTSSLSGCMVG